MRKCKWCDSTNLSIEPQFFKDGSAHIALGCDDCGRHIQYINKDKEKKASNTRAGVSENRSTLIRRAGFDSFDQYKESSRFRDIVTRCLIKNKHKCHFCKDKASAIAYSFYTQGNINGGDLDGLYSVCRFCDYKLRFDTKNKPRSTVIFKQLKLMKKCLNRGYIIAD